MSNTLFASGCNPIRFYEVAPNQSPLYLTKRFDDYPFRYQIKEWQERSKYVQKWATNDTTTLQFESDFASIQIEIVNRYNQRVRLFVLSKKMQNMYEPNLYAYETPVYFAGLPPGCYGMNMYVGGQNTPYAYTEPFHLKDRWPNTLLYEYNSTELYHLGVIFGTGIVFKFRVEGTIDYPKFGAKSTGFINQQQDPILTNSTPTTIYPMVIGGSYGVPAWVPSLLSYIYACDNVITDGHKYGKDPEEEFNYKDIENYAMKAITFEVMEGINRPGKVFNINIDTNKKFGIILPLSGRIIGENSPTGPTNAILITSLG